MLAEYDDVELPVFYGGRYLYAGRPSTDRRVLIDAMTMNEATAPPGYDTRQDFHIKGLAQNLPAGSAVLKQLKGDPDSLFVLTCELSKSTASASSEPRPLILVNRSSGDHVPALIAGNPINCLEIGTTLHNETDQLTIMRYIPVGRRANQGWLVFDWMTGELHMLGIDDKDFESAMHPFGYDPERHALVTVREISERERQVEISWITMREILARR